MPSRQWNFVKKCKTGKEMKMFFDALPFPVKLRVRKLDRTLIKTIRSPDSQANGRTGVHLLTDRYAWQNDNIDVEHLSQEEPVIVFYVHDYSQTPECTRVCGAKLGVCHTQRVKHPWVSDSPKGRGGFCGGCHVDLTEYPGHLKRCECDPTQIFNKQHFRCLWRMKILIFPQNLEEAHIYTDIKNTEYHQPASAAQGSQLFCYCQRVWNIKELAHVSPITCKGADCFWNNYFHRSCLVRAGVDQRYRFDWTCPDCRDAETPPQCRSCDTTGASKSKLPENKSKTKAQAMTQNQNQNQAQSQNPNNQNPNQNPTQNLPPSTPGGISQHSLSNSASSSGVPVTNGSSSSSSSSSSNVTQGGSSALAAAAAANAAASSTALGNFPHTDQQNLSLAQTISQLGHLPLMGGDDHETCTLEGIDKKHINMWRPNELVHWVSTFKNKKFSKYAVNIMAHSLDGREISMLSQSAVIKICNDNRIHGELVYKGVRKRLRMEENPVPGQRRARDQSLEEWAAEEAKFSAAMMDEDHLKAPLKAEVEFNQARLYANEPPRWREGNLRIGRKKRCKTAVTVRDVITYVDGFERVMENGKLSRRVAAGRADAPISRGSYHNYLSIKERLVSCGYDLVDPEVLDASFKHLLSLKEGKSSKAQQQKQQSRRMQGVPVHRPTAIKPTVNHPPQMQQPPMQQQAMQQQAMQQQQQAMQQQQPAQHWTVQDNRVLAAQQSSAMRLGQ